MQISRSTDAFVDCRCGLRHWGLLGAAGLLVWNAGARADREADTPGVSSEPRPLAAGRSETRVLLQLRAGWSHHGNTWGLPGGASAPGESAIQTALRESIEELGLSPHTVAVRHVLTTMNHTDWSYRTVIADAVRPLVLSPNGETADARWVPVSDVEGLPLHPGLQSAWPELQGLLRRPILVVDAANVVGSRPDGWWKDRPGAAARLLTHLASVATWPGPALGFAAARTLPEIHVVLEGQARRAHPEGVYPSNGHHAPGGTATAATSPVHVHPARGTPAPVAAPPVHVHHAPGEGDETILELAVRLHEEGADVVVGTADRELRHWLESEAVRAAGPRAVWDGSGGGDHGT